MTISIVIPIYNSAAYLQRCVDSVLRQDYQDIELVLVDDGSDDESGAICDDYRENNTSVKVIHQANQGRSMARWNGVEAATGEWLTFVDSDDILPKESCRLLAEKTSDSVDIVLGGGNKLPVKHGDIIDLSEFRHLAVRAEGYIGLPWGSLYRRNFLRSEFFDIDREIYMGEDYIFWLRMAFATKNPIAVVDEKIYCKQEEHTCNTFVWTADYAQRINDLRIAAIPEYDLDKYILDTLEDRIVNLFAVAKTTKRKEWESHPFYQDILRDVKKCGYTLSFKQRLFLSLPAVWLRKLYSDISNRIHKA